MRVVVKSEVVMRDRGCRCGGILCPNFEVVGGLLRVSQRHHGVLGLLAALQGLIGDYLPCQLRCLKRIEG
jgi:hypothetical protein